MSGTINTDTVKSFTWLNSYGTPITLLSTFNQDFLSGKKMRT
jgi:hypothetical protein